MLDQAVDVLKYCPENLIIQVPIYGPIIDRKGHFSSSLPVFGLCIGLP